MRIASVASLAALVAFLSAAAYEPPVALETCPEGTDPYVEYRLFFGRSTADGQVSDADWHAFLAREVTSRFPEGLTVLNAYGQWKRSSGELLREQSKVVLILAPPGDSPLRQTQAIAEAYKSRFSQESVLRVVTDACVAF